MSLPIIGGIGMGVLSIGLNHALDVLDKPASRVRDQQVSILLNAHDAVNLQRAQYLIQDLNCDVQRRLPSNERLR
jgi:hypothetical protein